MTAARVCRFCGEPKITWWVIRDRVVTELRTLQVKVHLKSSTGYAELRHMQLDLPIAEVARRSGVAASALRYYEERGLISAWRAVLRRIAFIVFAQRIGLTLEEIGELLARLPQDRVPTGRDWSRLSAGWTARIDERIAELERMKEGLTGCIGCGCLSLEHCQLANPGDRAARAGPGPRLWIGDRKP